jgi:hypothetical protein
MVKAPSLPGCAKAIVEINKVKAKKKVLLSIIVIEKNRGNNFIIVTDFIIFFFFKMTTKKIRMQMYSSFKVFFTIMF